MKWFDKWFSNKVKKSWENANQTQLGTLVKSREIEPIRGRGMNFSVYRASGGYVVEARQYDPVRDHSDTKLHIVTDDQDLGNELGKIVSFEALRA